MLKVCFPATETYVFDRDSIFSPQAYARDNRPYNVLSRSKHVINKRQQITYKLQMTTRITELPHLYTFPQNTLCHKAVTHLNKKSVLCCQTYILQVHQQME